MKTTQKILSVLLMAIITCALFLTGCQNDKLVIETPEPDPETNLVITDTTIVIRITEDVMAGATDMTLMDYMTKLKEANKLDFKISDGMITSINGVDNPADYSSCWMLYTSDEENANKAWGTVEYEGEEYGSAVSGAEVLNIKPDQLYIWVYKSFS